MPTLRYNEILAPHTSWHIGGPADRYFRPHTLEELATFLQTLSAEEKVIWLGLGSNVLIHDEGIRGTVIHLLNLKSTDTGTEIIEENKTSILVRADAGIPCAKLAKFCAKQGLAGGAFFAGIPGTIGGALFMNAGAFGGETWNHVEKVEIMSRQGERRIRLPDEYAIAYRQTKGPDNEWFVAGYFRFSHGKIEEAEKKIKELLQLRSSSQPIGTFTGGSTFKNPPNNFAGRLIEASGLKGFQIGGACISPKHANFIINLGNATAKDIYLLIEHVMNTVEKNHQIRLQPEVKFLGF